jgi:hypothetical protein
MDQDGNALAHIVDQDSLLERDITFQPFTQGVRMWLKVTAHEDIAGSYCLQQCLRFTGAYNAAWRQSIAHIPLLSELDMQAMGNPKWHPHLRPLRTQVVFISGPAQPLPYPSRFSKSR